MQGVRYAMITSCSFLLGGIQGAEKFSFSRPCMGTVFSVTCYAEDQKTAEKHAAASFAIAEEVNRVASDYLPDSELALLSTHPPEKPIKLSPLLFELLAHSQHIAMVTDGAFDPTLGPLSKLWRQSRKDQHLPDSAELNDALARTGWKNFSLEKKACTITLHRSGMHFDLGGIAKGYAADLMYESLAAAGLRQALITAGGDVRVGDAPPGRSGWSVALKTFDLAKTDEILVLANAAVSTSGDLHQSVTIDGISYSHIIDPQTGLGLKKRVAASVVAAEGKWSDPLATAACILRESALDSIRKLPHVKKVIVKKSF